MAGPFGCPWLTFAALIAVAAAAVASIVWALVVRFDEDQEEETPDQVKVQNANRKVQNRRSGD